MLAIVRQEVWPQVGTLTLRRSCAARNCGVAMPRVIDNPEHWRVRAKESRTLAEQMNDAEVRRIMLGIADSCEFLAERAVERAKRNIFSNGRR